ncbi:MAG: class I SAM-dependent methyltransferase [Sphaerochaeta sp.]|jgi:ubiquinone/menaquinone biosynthesis C-methylase UbiE|nr:class I SAM-dependent methyltransferase [Sphaerochaeta sp.]
MNPQKTLWENLAKKNPLYYINSDFGKGITEKQFRESGRKDYCKYVLNDDLIDKDFWKSTFLEIGCGIGRMTEFIAYDFKKVIGTDISKTMIEKGRERLSELDNVKLVETDGETIPLEDCTVDVAFSYLVFQHFKTKQMVIKNFQETYRVLKPGGIFKARVRIDKIKDMKPWWAGVDCNESYAVKCGFTLLKREEVKNYGLWLWLVKQ